MILSKFKSREKQFLSGYLMINDFIQKKRMFRQLIKFYKSMCSFANSKKILLIKLQKMYQSLQKFPPKLM